MHIVVLGCGVVGLSSAITLREAGFSVEIWAREQPPNTTSNVAAAIWHPFHAHPQEFVKRWAATTYVALERLARIPTSGVRMHQGLEIFAQCTQDPFWGDATRSFQRVPPPELPAGYHDGYAFEAPIVEMPIYLSYLMHRFASFGGRVFTRTALSLEQALAECHVVVHSTGLGARSLAHDHSMYAIRGQVVRVTQPGIERFWLDEHGPHLRYVIPRSNDCILGGTVEIDQQSLEPDPAITRAIVERCAELEPRLQHARILSHYVGLRPARPTVRLEAERVGDKLVVHNYGHGGSGVTLSWGCAHDVVRLVQQTSRVLPTCRLSTNVQSSRPPCHTFVCSGHRCSDSMCFCYASA